MFKKAQDDRPSQPIAKERIRPRPKPLGEKDLSKFEPRKLPVDPVKMKAREGEGVLKKKRKKKSVPAEAGGEPGPKKAKETPAAKDTPEVARVMPTAEAEEVVPVTQVAGGVSSAEPSGGQQTQKGPAHQEGRASLSAAFYHARAVAGKIEGEVGPARAGADRLLQLVEGADLHAASRFNEADLLRGLCSAQMEVTTLAGALLRKAGGSKLRAERAEAQLAKLKVEKASWESAQAELQTVKTELEDTRRRVVSAEFQLAGAQRKLEEAQRACAIANDRHEEAMSNNEELVRQKDEADAKVEALQKELEEERVKAEEEKGRLMRELEAEMERGRAEKESLRKESEAERDRSAAERETLQEQFEAERGKWAAEREALMKELSEERAKAASERAAYPDLCVAAVEQFKGSPEFQMAVDAAVASNLAREDTGGAGPSRPTAEGRAESEVIASFQQSDFYKHEMSEYWDSGWKMCKRRVEELFPDLDLGGVVIGEDDVAQTPLDEGVEEEDLASSEGEE
ncbi:hypothetical protein LOK49_LG10G00511 [Camellia lanceoleosa]|uniref:Uncharacterized protein n=1 Tax=Camellia lanceoleosa TaxID=1840588 RepID=A0ACC0GC95_9ERIC|nr:hypothetical protein LOK49_LG10G00511 [Camellia lanceoleosa]